jgi:hypothetical protein
MMFRHFDLAFIIAVAFALPSQGLLEAGAQEPQAEDIGVFTAVEGQVSVTRSGTVDGLPAKLNDDVRFLDVIETERESRSKALLNDDSILTVGEHSRVEITEHVYDPSRSVRTVVVNLVSGKVRALVGRIFTGTGSKFEVHTPSAVASARGTYFVVWHVDGVSGIANVGSHGAVDFQSGGSTVRVEPGNFSIAPAGGGPPSSAAALSGSNLPAQVAAAVQETIVEDTPKPESPSQAVLSLSGQAAMPYAGLLQPSGSVSGGNGQVSANVFPSVVTGTLLVPTTTTVTVPSVISGAAGSGSSGTNVSSPPPTSPPPVVAPPPVLPPPPPVVVPPPPVLPPVDHRDHGLHLGQRGQQPGHGGPVPGHDGGHHGNGHRQ